MWEMCGGYVEGLCCNASDVKHAFTIVVQAGCSGFITGPCLLQTRQKDCEYGTTFPTTQGI